MDYEDFNNKQICDILSKFRPSHEIKVLYVSTYIPNYIRTEAILNIFRRNKIKVEFIHGGNSKFRYFTALFNAILKKKEFDVIFLAFRSHEIFPVFRLITKKAIIFDAFVSLYDTVCLDRKIFKPNSIIGKVLKYYDTYLCRIADLVLVDTKTHCEYFKREFNAKNISYLYLESNRGLFQPIKIREEKAEDKFIVFWYGKCWPLQGADIILKTAEVLRDDLKIVFRLVGPVRERYRHLVGNSPLPNIEFIEYIPYERLCLEINKADLCLGGHFSDIPKAKRVVAGKTFQFIACGKKTILGDNPANRELFHETEDIYFVKMNSEKDLATLISKIKNKEQRLRSQGRL